MLASKKPNIILWNAQSITSKLKQSLLEYFAHKHKIDIILIVETYLKPQHALKLNNFIVYRNDRLTHAHGGVAIAIRDSLQHKIVSPTQTNIIENIAIEMLIDNTPTRIVAAYCPKQSVHFENDIRLLTSIPTHFMIFGDFNAKHSSWNCTKTNKAGNQLYALQQTNNFLIYHSPEHTHHPHSGQTASTIDILLSNVDFRFELSTIAGHLASDHDPVLCAIEHETQHLVKKQFDYPKADWNKYRRIIESRTQSLISPTSNTEIDQSINDFSRLILEAQAESIPLKKNIVRPNISSHTKQLIHSKNALKRRWQRTHIEPEKSRLKSELNRLQKQINNTVKADQSKYWDNKLKCITKGSKKLWNLSKQYRGKFDSSIDKIKIPGSHSISDADKANCLANIFEESHKITAHFVHEDDRVVTNTMRTFNCFASLHCHAPVIEVEEVNMLIKSLKSFKSAGPDTIQNILLKNLPQNAIVWLTNVLNKCIKSSYWPINFKTAKVMPILKSGKAPSDPRSYRPISLLNSIGKILEKIVYKRLIKFVEEKNLLPNQQFGFRRGHSTIHQATRIKQFIRNNQFQGKSTGVVLLDIEKAFDSIWHDGLIYKLIKMKIPTYLMRLINAFIRNRHFAVHINNSASNNINIPAGLAQGTCISPLLYSLYVADMPSDDKVNTALYADDTAIYTAAKQSNTIVNRLNNSLAELQKYFIKWKIKSNITKTQAIIFPFNNQRRRTPTVPLKNGQEIIELSKSIKYLGITFDSKLTFGQHITNAIDKANKCFKALFPMLAPKSHLSINNKTLIYNAVIRPIMTYGSPVWSTAANVHIKKFTVMQNKILKLIFNLHQRTPTNFMEILTGICHINDFIEYSDLSFIENCHRSDFELIREIDLL